MRTRLGGLLAGVFAWSARALFVANKRRLQRQRLNGLSRESTSPILKPRASLKWARPDWGVNAQISLIDSANEFAFSIGFRQQ
ncbi:MULTISPECIES: hypothetical protein [unclassified Paraburkholderia]|uniref:hypothetical protein n=1 Tax=unclassified Paraburkholderia TaxID=2615204 RepID=UPI001607CC94|nr:MULTISPECIES: hypothetical protein [unclassified Paraburkholderia]MBB5441779.1 hypothetical protein [Paraburkholderia sp. WSM4177]MBB5482175.1 hypothetical protein [Paraburkholderia sp. WSM4180]